MVLIEQFLMRIFLWILTLIDGLMDIFSAISGIDNVHLGNEEVNMLETFMGDDVVTMIFWCIFILTVGLGCVFLIVALVKNIISNNRNITSIVGKFFLFLIGTVAILAVLYVGILIINTVLQLLTKVFGNGTTKLSNAMFNACVGGRYTKSWTLEGILAKEGVTSITELDIDKIMGGHKNWAIFASNKDWKNDGYIITSEFQYLPAFIGSGVLLFELVVVTLHLAKRLFEIIFLYFIMPASLSTLPMDDGARFKNWRETFVTKLIIVYGAVIAVNVFFILSESFARMYMGDAPGGTKNSLFYIFMIAGGAMMMQGGIELFAKVLGHGDDMHQERRAIFMLGRATFGIGRLAAHTAGDVAKRFRDKGREHTAPKKEAKRSLATEKYRKQFEEKAERKEAKQRWREAQKEDKMINSMRNPGDIEKYRAKAALAKAGLSTKEQREVMALQAEEKAMRANYAPNVPAVSSPVSNSSPTTSAVSTSANVPGTENKSRASGDTHIHNAPSVGEGPSASNSSTAPSSAATIVIHGKDGKNGKDGKDGRNGRDGKNGAQGRPGPDGKNGQASKATGPKDKENGGKKS